MTERWTPPEWWAKATFEEQYNMLSALRGCDVMPWSAWSTTQKENYTRLIRRTLGFERCEPDPFTGADPLPKITTSGQAEEAWERVNALGDVLLQEAPSLARNYTAPRHYTTHLAAAFWAIKFVLLRWERAAAAAERGGER